MNDYRNMGDFKPNRYDENVNSRHDTVILIIVGWFVFSRLLHAVLPKVLMSMGIMSNWQIVFLFTSLIWAVVPFLLATLIRNKSTKTIVLVLAVIHALISLSSTLYTYFGMLNGF